MSSPPTGVVLVVPAERTSHDCAIQAQLAAAGVRVRTVSDLPAAMRCAAESPLPEALVLMAGATGADDGDAVECIRRSGFSGAIVVVDRDSDSASAAAVLDRGADDYVGAPCDASELVARVRAHARRAGAATVLERDLGGMVLDLRRSVVRCDDVEVSLTRREADLLDYLARNAGHPVTRDELAAHVWHAAPDQHGTNVVDVYVSYLRRKLGVLGRKTLIRSVRGVGYQFCRAAPGVAAGRYNPADARTPLLGVGD